MKTLLQINTVVNSGSTGRIAEEIGQIVMANGWRSYIAYGRNERPSQSELIKIGNNWDIKIHGLQTRLFDRHGLASKKATKQLVQQITQIKPDVIHLHNLHGYYLNIEILFNFLNKAGIPVVWTLHDCWPITGHCTHFDFTGCEKWKTQCSQCPQKKEYPASFFTDRSKTNYILKKRLFTSVNNLTLVPVSDWLAGLISQSYLSAYPVQVIHNGINTDIFKPVSDSSFRVKFNLQNKIILLGVASVWSPRKGLKNFVELSQNLDSNYQVILVGLTKNQIKSLPKNIIAIERTENIQELAAIYSAADIFINPTWEDNFPTTNIEALACGTPVITYNSGGSPEAIDSDTGFVVEKGNIEALIKAVKQIKAKNKTFYSTACRERARLLFNKHDRFSDYITLFESLLSK
jgi:glycosyltransferase involved in cell wall biosynthesis